MYYTHPGCRTSILGENRAYCIRDFTVNYNFLFFIQLMQKTGRSCMWLKWLNSLQCIPLWLMSNSCNSVKFSTSGVSRWIWLSLSVSFRSCCSWKNVYKIYNKCCSQVRTGKYKYQITCEPQHHQNAYPHHKNAFGPTMTLTFDLWPFQQCHSWCASNNNYNNIIKYKLNSLTTL